MTELEKKNDRVWEVDAFRGFLIFCVLWSHMWHCVRWIYVRAFTGAEAQVLAKIDPMGILFLWNEEKQCWGNAMIDRFIDSANYPGVVSFFLVSGIACWFSRNVLTRGLKMLAGAMCVSAFTGFLGIWTDDSGQFIRFGALHCYAYCHLIYYFLLKGRKERTILICAIASIVIGTYLRTHYIETPLALLYPFGFHEFGTTERDYWPIFPMLGWMLIGVLLGKRFYRQKESLFPEYRADQMTQPLQWLGRYSGVIYLIHIPLYSGICIGIEKMLGLL